MVVLRCRLAAVDADEAARSRKDAVANGLRHRGRCRAGLSLAQAVTRAAARVAAKPAAHPSSVLADGPSDRCGAVAADANAVDHERREDPRPLSIRSRDARPRLSRAGQAIDGERAAPLRGLPALATRDQMALRHHAAALATRKPRSTSHETVGFSHSHSTGSPRSRVARSIAGQCSAGTGRP